MQFVYLLTNLDKSSGKRLYVGAKEGAKIISIDGVASIINVRDGRPYYSSSQSFEFKADMMSGHRFEATILEKVPENTNVYERETYWLKKLSCAEDEKYYNISDSLKKVPDQDVIINIYGETYKEYASRQSSFSKRENTATKLGFKDFCALYLHIGKESETKTMAQISRELGRHRHFAKSLVEKVGYETFNQDLSKKGVKEGLRSLVSRGCSFYKACEMLDIGIMAGRELLGDFHKSKTHRVAYLQGKSSKELQQEVFNMVLEIEDFTKAANELGITRQNCVRYFIREVKERLGG